MVQPTRYSMWLVCSADQTRTYPLMIPGRGRGHARRPAQPWQSHRAVPWRWLFINKGEDKEIDRCYMILIDFIPFLYHILCACLSCCCCLRFRQRSPNSVAAWPSARPFASRSRIRGTTEASEMMATSMPTLRSRWV